MVYACSFGEWDAAMASVRSYYYLLGEDKLPIMIRHTVRPAKDILVWNYSSYNGACWRYAGQITWKELSMAVYLGRAE